MDEITESDHYGKVLVLYFNVNIPSLITLMGVKAYSEVGISDRRFMREQMIYDYTMR